MDYKDCDVIIVGNAYLDKFVFLNKVVKTYQCVLSEIVDKFYSIAVSNASFIISVKVFCRSSAEVASPVTM